MTTTAQSDPEYVANVLVDAVALGDNGAARKWGIHIRTVGRYRARMKVDPALAKLVTEKNAEVSHDLATLRVSFLREALDVARIKLKTSTLYEVAGAIKIVGELHATAMMIGDDGELGPVAESEATPGAADGGKVVLSGADGSTDARH